MKPDRDFVGCRAGLTFGWFVRFCAAMARLPLLQRFRVDLLTYWSLLALLAVVALTGGSARATSLGQVVVLSAATLAATAWIALVPSAGDRRLRWGFAFLGLCAALICLQLVPLPPSWWRSLPGREAYVAAAAAAGVEGVWRPLSLAPDLSWSALFALLVPAALLVGLARMSTRRRVDLLLPLAALIFASGVLGLAQVSGGPDSPLRWYGGNPDPSAVGFLANRNHQALLLACALPILAALASLPSTRPNRQRAMRWGALGVGAFIVLMLPSTGSRAGLVVGGVSILLAVAIAAPSLIERLRSMRRRRRRRVLAGGAGALIAFVAILLFLGQNVAFTRLATLDPMSDQRVRAFPTVSQMTRTFFPWGSGVGTFEPVFRHFEPFGLLKLTYFNQAHNDIVQLVLEGGVFAAALLAAFLLWWAVASVRAWRAPASGPALAARAGSAVVLLCLIASIVDYPLRTALMLAIFCVASVWLLAPTSSRDAAEPRG
jgi:O-antigen ligase